MFIPAQVGDMRKRCLKDFEELVRELSISVDWSNDDEDRASKKFDEELEQKLSARLKSKSVTSGYTSLLKLGDLPYSYDELDSVLLDRIVTNKDKIIEAVRNQNVQSNSWQDKYGSNTSPGKERVETLNIEATNIKRFDMRELIYSFENVKRWLKQNSKQSTTAGLGPIVKSIRPWIKEYPLASKMVDFFQALLDTCETSKRDNLEGSLRAIDSCISQLEKLDSLFENNGKTIQVENLQDLVQNISNQLRDNGSHTICLTIKKNVEMCDKKIPSKPPEPKFTVNEAEEALNILERLNEIVKRIKG